jgi:hypothetical protein
MDNNLAVRRAYLAENKDVGGQTLIDALELRRLLRAAVEEREAYVQTHGLDPAICLPAANWAASAPNDYIKAYRHVRDGGFDVLNRLLFFGQVFSGFNAMTLEPSRGLSSVRPVIPDLDRWIDENRSTNFLDAWLAITSGIPSPYLMRPPAICGQHGLLVDDVIVNLDTIAYQERISLLHDAGILDRLRGTGARILEIGGGYGALACALHGMLSPSQYVICDLPESLMFSGLYLRLVQDSNVAVWTLPDYRADRSGFGLLPNYMFHQLPGGDNHFDLVINTISMSEMSPAQVADYAAGISKLIGTDGVFFEQNTTDSGPETADCGTILPHFFKLNEDIVTARPVGQGVPRIHANHFATADCRTTSSDRA